MSRVGQAFPYQAADLNQDGQQGWGPRERAVLIEFINTVQQAVTVDGLDINGNLNVQGHGLANTAFVQMALNGDAGQLMQQWVDASGDLWYRDGNNRAVQLTLAGALAVAASTGGWTGDLISTNPNGASYDNSVGVFNLTAPSPAGQAGKLNCGAVRIREGADTDYIGLNVPASLPGTYNLTFPATLPSGQNSVVVCDITGGLNYRLSASFTQCLDVSAATIHAGAITHANTGWPISNLVGVDMPINFQDGDRIDSIAIGTQGVQVTASLVFRSDAGNTAQVLRVSFNGGGPGTRTISSTTPTLTGTLPYSPPATGSLMLQVLGGPAGSDTFSTCRVVGSRRII